MRKIGFDFDGVLAEKVSFDGDLKKYRKNLLKAKPLLNPCKIKRSDDKIYIITGRCIENYYSTIKWLNKYYYNFDINNLFFVNEISENKIHTGFKNINTFRLYIAKMKYRKIVKLDLDVYFEDDEVIIKFLRQHCIKCKIINIKDIITTDFNDWIKLEVKKTKIIKLKDIKNLKDINHLKLLKELNT